MTATNEHDQDLHDGFVGISREDFEAMPDSELAQWQSNQQRGTPKYTLAEHEWQRRMISHQLKEQYDLDARLAKAVEAHAAALANESREHAERLSRVTGWYTIAAALVGVIGTLSGALLGLLLQATPQSAPQHITQSPTLPTSGGQALAPQSTGHATKNAP